MPGEDNNPSQRPPRRRLPAGVVPFGQALLVVAVAGAAGFAYNHARLTSGRLLAHTRYAPGPGELHRFVTLDEATEVFKEGEAIFIDSRSEASFLASHIPGAINIPADQKEERLQIVGDWIPPDAMVVIYGRKANFKKLYDVEDALLNSGFRPHLMREHFGIWQDRNLPVATGPEPIWEGQ